ncbi:formate dehydrogenase subunit alpha [Profundibacterium mesophilum]|uniref:Formate dehydrogenase N alpha subunit n=1 Tax=Profundibacterium mesophilum KAUST100406-0324 TaxID=1037889 RepID=A0A921TCS7_9RHOB|nr:formate dehydrogenase subunit alpha [Profundibacterium mesophilum]KAF0676033.1 Formate dehydrogenase N alpha subunit [Profundibacterium mesophilum KAUST100406-0324]
MLKRKTNGRHSLFPVEGAVPAKGQTRRDFLRNSGLASVSLGAFGMGASRVRAQTPEEVGLVQTPVVRKTICQYCSVGCSMWAEVENGVWTGQEPAFESPINQGTHCAKGAAMREVALGERRLKYPMKKVDGQWQRISWDQALTEVSQKLLAIREKYGPDSAYWLGSAKYSNEQSYIFRKFAAYWGTNNVDHQARICHSTTVAGVANSFGYGAMTNTFNDIRNSKSIIIIGGNPAEAHPVSMLHVLNGKENGAKMIVVDPRFTRTAAHADEYVRIRPGSDVGFLWGLVKIILDNGWEDAEFLQQRVWGIEQVRAEVQKWTPEEVERVCGIAPEQTLRIAQTLAENRPGTLVWCMGLTQSTIGSSKTRAASILQLVLGNMGKTGGGTNIFRGHDNVQGATDLGVSCETLPAYYGLEEGAWKHWCRVWGTDYEYMKSRFQTKELMEKSGMPLSRWMDAVLEDAENIEQPNPVKAMTFWGHAANSITRGPEQLKAMADVELLCVIDPYPTQVAAMVPKENDVYLLPAATTAELHGSVTNSSRSVQWRDKVVEPLFESKTDYWITYQLAKAFGFADEMFKNIEVENGEPVAESILREINKGTWTIGYTAQSPERLKLHMQHQDKFDSITLEGKEEPVKGEYYCLPWPAWGQPEQGHPGTPILYDTSKSVAQGGLPFRARWGVEYEGENLLAEDSYTNDSEIRDGYPEGTLGMIEALGWADELTPKEKLIIISIGTDAFNLGLLDLDDVEASRQFTEIETQLRTDLEDIRSEAEVQDVDEAWQNGSNDEGGDDSANTADNGNGGAKGAGGTAANPDQGERVAQRFPDYPRNAQIAIRSYLKANPQKSDENEQLSVADMIRRVNWKTDLSGGIQRVMISHGLAPYGNGKARAVVWNFPDKVPQHREPLYTVRRDLLPEYETYEDRRMWRLPILYKSIQDVDYSQEFPMVLTSGRLVEYEGGGDETRSNIWLAEFQQQMFVEINPADAGVKGITDGNYCWVETPVGRIKVAALVTPRVGPGTVFLPFHFAGMWMGEDISDRYPEGARPFVIGEATNTAQTYGYDIVTQMQETKATICRIEAA